MAYGILKVDTITFTDGGVDKSVPVSGLVQNPTFTGNITATGTISGNIIQGGTTVSGLTVTGTTANFASGVFTTQVSGVTVIATTGTFTSLTGTTTNGTTASFTTGTFTSLTGTTTTGTTANFASGVFTTQVSGVTVIATTGTFTSLTGTTTNGTTASFTTGTFTSLTGTTTTGTTANFASGVFTTQVSGVTVIATTGTFTSITGTTTNGTTASFTTGNFTSLTGTTTTGTTANFASGVFTTQISGVTVIATTGTFTSLTGTTTTMTSGVFASGTEPLPSISFVSDPNTGIYSPGADQLAVATNGVERVEFGTAEVVFNDGGENYDFRVEGDTNANLLFVDASTDAIGMGVAPSIGDGLLTLIAPAASSGAGTANVRLGMAIYEFANGRGLWLGARTDENTGVIGTRTASGNLAFETYNGGWGERMRLTYDGRLGIGTTDPSSTLSLGGNMDFKQSSNLSTTTGYLNINPTSTLILDGGSGASIDFKIGGADKAKLDSSGRLLVGTTTNTLNINNTDKQAIVLIGDDTYGGLAITGYNGTSNPTLRGPRLTLQRSRGTTDGSMTKVASDDLIGQISFRGADGTDFEVAATIEAYADGEFNTSSDATDSPGRLVFSTTADGASSPTPRMTIKNDGDVFIGTTSPQVNERLRVVRDSITTNAATVDIYNSAAISTTKLASPILRVSSQGAGADASIVITDNASYNYFFGGNNGGAYVTAMTNGVRLSNGGTSWASDSDERVKDIIEPIQDGLDKVGSLRAVIGKYKTDDEDKRRSFLIAQDVQAVLPEAVFDEQGTLMLAYTETIPLLVAALKESKERIEQLETSNTDLLARVIALEAN